jgi:PIN domain nuclease of toxin-antitoxin system
VAGVIADTHAIIWYLLDSPRLSAPALAQFEACRTEGVTIGVASISSKCLIYQIVLLRPPQCTWTCRSSAVTAKYGFPT